MATSHGCDCESVRPSHISMAVIVSACDHGTRTSMAVIVTRLPALPGLLQVVNLCALVPAAVSLVPQRLSPIANNL